MPRNRSPSRGDLRLCREPSADEMTKMRTFLQNESLEQLCRVILNLNEFVYPE
jgi:hypothetical protein